MIKKNGEVWEFLVTTNEMKDHEFCPPSASYEFSEQKKVFKFCSEVLLLSDMLWGSPCK